MTKARDLANAGTALTSVSATELGYLDGVTSAVQTQLNAKQAVVSGVNDTEIGYLDGVTSAIQTQLDAKAVYPSQTGNSGKYLTTDGTNASWGTVSAGGMTLISSGTMSGASVSVNIPTGYVNVMWIVQGATLSSSDQIFFRINGNTSGVYQSSYTTRQGTGSGQNYVSYNNNSDRLLIDGTCTSGSDINFVFEIFNVDTTAQHAFRLASNWVSGLGESQQNWVGKYSATGAITSLSVSRYGASATFNAGTYYLYGIK